MKITLLRHTEVEEAYFKCYNGHIDIGLSLNGEKQAKLLAQEFSEEKFDLVYCSDLLRTRPTLAHFPQKKTSYLYRTLTRKVMGKT